MAEPENTSFSTVHDLFLSKVTDDMYMELYVRRNSSFT